jgi:hypothetical protein
VGAPAGGDDEHLAFAEDDLHAAHAGEGGEALALLGQHTYSAPQMARHTAMWSPNKQANKQNRSDLCTDWARRMPHSPLSPNNNNNNKEGQRHHYFGVTKCSGALCRVCVRASP